MATSESPPPPAPGACDLEGLERSIQMAGHMPTVAAETYREDVSALVARVRELSDELRHAREEIDERRVQSNAAQAAAEASLAAERAAHDRLAERLAQRDAIADAAESYLEGEGGPGDDDARLHLCTLLADRVAGMTDAEIEEHVRARGEDIKAVADHTRGVLEAALAATQEVGRGE